MSPETADQVIRFILETHVSPKVKLDWFGGEPLLGESIIDRVCEGLQEAGLEFSSAMTTNGSFITPEIIKKMAGVWKLTQIQISMDGAEQDYILRKRYIADRDYYHQVIESVSRLSDAGFKVTVSCKVDEENWGRTPQFLEDLSGEVTDKKDVTVVFSPLFSVRQSEDDLAMYRKILSARPLTERAGFTCKPLMGSDLNYRIFRCKAASGNVSIWPDGT